MSQRPLMEVLEEVVSRMRELEKERDEAIARAQAHEREVIELVNLINSAAAKLENLLDVELAAKPHPVEPAEQPTRLPRFELLHEFSPDPHRLSREDAPGAPGAPDRSQNMPR